MKPTESDIEAMCNEAKAQANEPSRLSGLSYEEGVCAALEWVLGQREEPPLDDELPL